MDSGLVEVYDGISKWGGICGISWGLNDALRVCRHMGYGSALYAFSTLPDVEGQELFLRGIFYCPNSALGEQPLGNCSYRAFDICPTGCYLWAGVVCAESTPEGNYGT